MNENLDNVVEEQQNTENKVLTFDEMLASSKEYQSEFDRRLAKSNKTFLDNEKVKWEKEYNDKLQAEKSEAEKLAKMNVEQQLNYRISQLEKEKETLTNRVNASSLMETTGNILTENNIPLSYLKMFDFEKENADTINSKVELLKNIRSQDLQDNLNKALRQPSPRNVKNEEEEIDPYVEGFLSEL